MTNAHELLSQFGQSVWLDHFDRSLLERGGLNLLILDGVRGVVSNPGLYRKAIVETGMYDDAIRDFVQTDDGINGDILYQWLQRKDACMAADLLREVYDGSGGLDGYVSVELPANVAYDSADAIEAARHLWKRIDRENLMIKLPATVQGVQALEVLIAEGVNVNMTYLYSMDDYKAVADAYIRGLVHNPNPAAVFSVASFSINDLDFKINHQLDELGIAELQAVKYKTAVSNATMAFRHYRQILESTGFQAQRKRGARMQRLLWSDTTPAEQKKPRVFYMEQLIGEETVVALQPEAFDEFLLSGQLIHSLDDDISPARRIFKVLDSLDIDLAAIIPQLRAESIQSLADSRQAVFAALDQKRLQLASEYA